MNLMALPTRLTSTCRSRSGSPTSASGTSASMSSMQLEPLSRARASASGFSVSSSTVASENVDRLELELARFDLREVEDVVDDDEQRVGRRRDGLAGIRAAPAVSRCVERELGHADDAVHRRADLVAHVREELALGAVGLFRRLFRVDECDGCLVALGVEFLQVRRHLVQAVGQLAELVAAVERNHRVPIARADPDGAALEQTDRLGDGMCHGHRAQEDEQGAGGKTHDTQVDDAPVLVRHFRVLGEQDLTALFVMASTVVTN